MSHQHDVKLHWRQLLVHKRMHGLLFLLQRYVQVGFLLEVP